MEILFQALTLLPKQFWNFSKSVYWTEVRESTLMPGYKVCYFTEQGRGLNLNKIENVHMPQHLIYITAIIKHLWVSGSLISINCILPQGFKFPLWLLILAAIFCVWRCK